MRPRAPGAGAPATKLRQPTRLWYGQPNMDRRPTTVRVELIPDPEQGGFTARLPDIPAYGEGQTEEAAVADLKEAVRGYIDAFGLDDALARLAAPTALRELDWDLTKLV